MVALFDAKLSSSKKESPDSTPLSVTALMTGAVRVLFVNVCAAVSLATVESTSKLTLVPVAVEVIPLPPNKPSVSESRSISIEFVPSVTSKS